MPLDGAYETHCLILCGGRNERWGLYRGTTRKHLLELEGEVLLARTLAQVLRQRRVLPRVVINQTDHAIYARLDAAAGHLYPVDPDAPSATPADKFLSSHKLWHPHGRTIVLLGDVWYSEAAIWRIFQQSRDWVAFGRAGASHFTGCPHGELFAHSFTESTEHEARLRELAQRYREGSCTRPASGWAHYQLMTGGDPNQHQVGARFISIDDFTEDFDRPADYENWVLGRARRQDLVTALSRVGRNAACPCGSTRKFKQCCGASA